MDNAGFQFQELHLENLNEENLRRTFNFNINGMILWTKAVDPRLKLGDSIINTICISYQGHEELADYSATKGAIVSFTTSMALHAKSKRVRLNAVSQIL
ncbi:SDR family oxidoreductase [Chryseobacterium sp. LJ756]|nr:SDR family oxidoreductase [Chryseobacterium sp. LJ756]